MIKKLKILASVIFVLTLWSSLVFAGWWSEFWSAKPIDEESVILQIDKIIDSDRCNGRVSGWNSSLIIWDMIDNMQWLKYRIKNIGSYAMELTPELEALVLQYTDVRCKFLITQENSCKVNEVGCTRENIADLINAIKALETQYNIQFGQKK